MGERKGTRGLELWCKKMTEGYPGVKIENMTTSWRDGLAFCAIIHHFRPELIDFSKLKKGDIYRNNDTAFRVAEQYLGIPALLEAEDMVEYPVPDRLSILTYLSQFYQTFAGSPSRVVPRRPVTVPDRGIVSPTSSSPPTKMAIRSTAGVPIIPARREPCAKCGLPVFIAERLNIGKLLFHRTCFQCARCNCQLTPGNCYELESGENQFCCETCPDEEAVPEKPAVVRSLSDEEKSASLKERSFPEYESAVDVPDVESSGEFATARSLFIHSLLGNSEEDDAPPDPPNTKPPDSITVSETCDGAPIDLSVNNISVQNSDSVQRTDENIITKESAQENTSQPSEELVKTGDSEIFIIDVSSESVIEISDNSLLTEKEEISTEVIETSEVCDKINNLVQCEETVHEHINEVNRKDCETTNLTEIENSAIESIHGSNSSLCNGENQEELSLKPEKDEEITVTPNEMAEKEAEKLYPDDLNPFSDDDAEEEPASTSLNPFGSDDEDEEKPTTPKQKLSVRKSMFKMTTGSTGDTPDNMKHVYAQRISINPFEDGQDEEEAEPARQLKVIPAPRMSLLPCDDCKKKPESASNRTNFGSTSSISSGTSSTVNSTRKKKPAPRPPLPFEKESPQPSRASSPSTSVHHSPKPRKNKRAPLPPSSTPLIKDQTAIFMDESPIADASLKSPVISDRLNFTLSPTNSIDSGEFEKEKVVKDEVNRNRQSQSLASPDSHKSFLINKSKQGKWKRKKGRAPSRPIPQKRTIKSLPIAEVRRELDLIELQLQGLEKQGVRLEQIIREHCEGPDSDPNSAVSIEAEDLILQLFEVVNEKNEICRRQSELMYTQRQHRLEVEYAEVEYQLRCLSMQHESNKTDSYKAREEELLERLLEIVDKRNEIVECLEMDRIREAEEDHSITSSMNSYALKRDENSTTSELEASPQKKEKKKSKRLKFKAKFKLSPKVDVDKDVDESESSISSSSSKDVKKKKFHLF